MHEWLCVDRMEVVDTQQPCDASEPVDQQLPASAVSMTQFAIMLPRL